MAVRQAHRPKSEISSMQTFLDKQKNALLRKYHMLLRQRGVNDEEKQVLLASYGVSSGRDLNVYELTELCQRIDMQSPAAQEADRWRKRVIAVVSQYLQLMHYGSSLDEVKSVVCRAAGGAEFNQISTDRLRSIYNAFNHRVNDMKFADSVQMVVNVNSITTNA